MSYCTERMTKALDERLQIVSKENLELRKEVEKLRQDYDSKVLKNRIEAINRYDEEVQKIISASPILSEAWDNFRVQYQLTASKTLLETANEKIAGRAKGVCHGCGRDFK